MNAKILIALAAGALALTACQYDDTDIQAELDQHQTELANHEARIAALEQSMSDLQAWYKLTKDAKFITTIADHGNGSYTVNFSDGTFITLKDGAKGEQGEKGDSGKTPTFKIEKETWYVSYDDGVTWTSVGSAIDKSLFQSVVLTSDGNLVVTLADGTIVKFAVGRVEFSYAKAVMGTKVVDAAIDDETKTLTFTCSPKAYAAATASKLTLGLNPGYKATDFDDQKDYDLVAGVSVTIVSEDGKSTDVWTIKAVQGTAQYSVVWEKKGELTIDNASLASAVIAFCAKDKFVTSGGHVYDLNGKEVGTLNTTGVSGTVRSMSNDVNGILTEWVKADAGAEIWVWYDGYDKAPTKIYSNETKDLADYGSVSGDYETGVVLSYRTTVTAAQQFHTVLYKKGDSAVSAWAWLATGMPGNDGNWGTMASACNYDSNKWGNVVFGVWDSQSGGANVYTKVGTRADTKFVAVANTLPGTSGWGNYSVGSVRGFNFEGKNYVAACTTGWPSFYFTVIDATDGTFAYGTQTYAYASGATSCMPQAAYVYDADNECAYIACGVSNSTASLGTGVILHRLGY